MLATSKNALFPGHNRLLTNSTDDPSLLIITRAPVIIKVLGHQCWWLAGGYDLHVEIGHFQKWLAWWIVVFFCTVANHGY